MPISLSTGTLNCIITVMKGNICGDIQYTTFGSPAEGGTRSSTVHESLLNTGESLSDLYSVVQGIIQSDSKQ